MKKCTHEPAFHRCWVFAALILFSWRETTPSTQAGAYQLHSQFASQVSFAASLNCSVHTIAELSMSTVSQSDMNCMDVSIGKNRCRSILGHTVAQVGQWPGGQVSQQLLLASLSHLLAEVLWLVALPVPPQRALRLPRWFAVGRWWGWALGRWRRRVVGI